MELVPSKLIATQKIKIIAMKDCLIVQQKK